MPLPFLMDSAAMLEARRKLTPSERRMSEDQSLRFRTNLAVLIAILTGVVVAFCHGGVVTVSIAAFGAALGMGGVLGFLFGVPGSSRTVNNIGSAETISIGPGSQSTTTATGTPPKPPAATAPDDASPNAAASQTPPTPVSAKEQTPEDQEPDTPPPGNGNAALPLTPPVAASNLEQVADWVTKLLLGGGLTQMQRIPPKIWQWSRIVAIGLVRDDAHPTEALIQAHQAFAAGLLVYGFILGFFAGFLITKLQFTKAISS